MAYIEVDTDVVVVGAGHAGCEAALACARLGLLTTIFTVSVDSIALMPCNPNIGGSSKGHLVLFSQKCLIAPKGRQFILCAHRQTRQNIAVPCEES